MFVCLLDQQFIFYTLKNKMQTFFANYFFSCNAMKTCYTCNNLAVC